MISSKVQTATKIKWTNIEVNDQYKLFGNLTVRPTTVGDTADASLEFQSLQLTNLTAADNMAGTYFIGNGIQLTGLITSVSEVINGAIIANRMSRFGDREIGGF